jgi:hypothetical protein
MIRFVGGRQLNYLCRLKTCETLKDGEVNRMVTWWYCPDCGKVTDEYESSKSIKCPECREKKDK